MEYIHQTCREFLQEILFSLFLILLAPASDPSFSLACLIGVSTGICVNCSLFSVVKGKVTALELMHP